MFDDLQVAYGGDDPDDAWVPDPEEQAEAAGFITELEDDARSVDRLDADGTLSEAEALRAAVIAAEVRQLDLAVHWADLHAVSDRPGGPTSPGAELLVQLGGDGTPKVLEFASAELACSLRVSDSAAKSLIADALDLRHRLPRLWEHLHGGVTPVWQARKTAHAARNLSKEAAGSVDRQIASYHGHLTWARMKKAVDAAMLRADPPKAMSDAEQAAAEAGVHYRPDEVEHGYGTMFIKAAAGDLKELNKALDMISRAMKILGDPRPPNQRRAAAIGIIADPDTAKALVEHADATRKAQAEAAAARRAGSAATAAATEEAAEADAEQAAEADAEQAAEADAEQAAEADAEQAAEADAEQAAEAEESDVAGERLDRRPLGFSKAVLYYHLTRESIEAILNGKPFAGAAVGRVEDIGPVIANQIREWLGHANVTVKPVIDLAGIAPVDRYETPPRITEAIGLVYPADYSPYASSTSRSQDHDHVQPYLPMNKGGPPGQTDPLKMAKLTRGHHRMKTHAGWTVTTLHPGTWLWRTPHGRYTLVDHHGTTPLNLH